MTSLNLQRNSEVFFSTIDLNGGAAVTAMTPSNTWKIEVLAGFAVSSSSATQDITSLESGLTPDRSQQRFNTAINPVEWNFQTYLRPTGVENGNTAGGATAATNTSGNVKPVADWFMWQSLASNTRVHSGTAEQSVWTNGGKLFTTNTAAGVGSHSTRSNFAIAQEDQYLYFKMDNIIYQVSNAAVNSAVVDAGIEEIAAVTWSGNGNIMRELTGTPRNNAVSVFGGTLNNGTSVLANSNAAALTRVASYHPYNQMNVAGVIATNSFIKNRLSSINFQHAASAGAAGVSYNFPVTALTLEYNNNITYLTPEEISTLNSPIGNFTGTRAVTGSATMYLRAGDSQSAQFLRNIMEDSRTTSAQTSNANLIVGGATAPYVAFAMPAVQFDFPQLAVEDVLAVSVNFMAQEPAATKGNGGEVTIIIDK
jgi:hypothetical protein